jgi:hypothetical protein
MQFAPFLQVAVLPVLDKDEHIWSLLRFFVDRQNHVWMGVDDSDHFEKVADFPDDGEIRRAMRPYLKYVLAGGTDPRLLVVPSVPDRYGRPMERVDLEGVLRARWDFEVADRSDGIHVLRVRRGPHRAWIDPKAAPGSVQDFFLLRDFALKDKDKAYLGGKMDTEHWTDVDDMVTETDYPRNDEEVALRAIAGQKPEGSVKWYPDIFPGRRRGSIHVEMPARDWRRYKFPKAEAKRMLKEFG